MPAANAGDEDEEDDVDKDEEDEEDEEDETDETYARGSSRTRRQRQRKRARAATTTSEARDHGDGFVTATALLRQGDPRAKQASSASGAASAPRDRPQIDHTHIANVGKLLDQYFPATTPVPVDPPAALKAALLPFQREGLAWMLAQEAGPLGGGILADEMGMGKTIQMIALLLAAPHSDEPTLVVCPTVRPRRQWLDAFFLRGVAC